MTPNSKRADGQPKKRWSAADRAARGHLPRRSGGQPRTPSRDASSGPRQPWSDRSTDRPSFNRDDRPQRSERPSFNRDDRPQRSERPSFNRDDRPQRSERPSFNRDDRPQRSERPSFNRDDRPQRSDRPWSNRDDRPQRSERPSFNRDDRPQRSERPWSNRDDRPQRSERPSFNRDDRPQRSDRPWSNRDDRPSFNRDDRPQRSERPSFNRDDRPQRARSERPSFDRDDRPQRSERPSFNRDDRPQRARSDRPSFFDSYDALGGRGDRARPHHASSPRTKQVRPPRDRDVDREPEVFVAPEPVTPTPAFEGTFADLGVPASLVSALTASGITTPFPIQAATIPDALSGRDVLGRGQTGSGKTLAFGLPMIANLTGSGGKPPRGLVLVPTRELAMQVTEALEPLARTAGLSMILIAGGMSYVPQLRAFSRGVDLVVATPGRLIDLMEQGEVDLSRVEVTVLDEADHMADLGFLPAVTTILDTVPDGGQRLLFSATLDSGVGRIVRQYLKDPVTHEVDSGQASVTTMSHHMVQVAPHDKAPVTAEIAAREGRTIVFVRTQRGADRVAEQLREAGVLAGALHGGLTQGARTRILAAFKEGQLPVLVATDVAARGIHVDDVGLVLQVDPPTNSKDYLHRAGRTARAGGTGVVVSLVLPHQRREVTRLTGQAGVRPTSLSGEPGSAELHTTTGGRRPSGTAVSESEFRRLVDPPPARRGGPGGKRRGPGARPGREGKPFRGGRGRGPGDRS